MPAHRTQDAEAPRIVPVRGASDDGSWVVDLLTSGLAAVALSAWALVSCSFDALLRLALGRAPRARVTSATAAGVAEEA